MARLKYRDRNLAGYCDKPGLGGRSYAPRQSHLELANKLRLLHRLRGFDDLRRRILVFLRGGVGECGPIFETIKTLFPEAMKKLRGDTDDILTALNRILRILGKIFNGSYRCSYAVATSGGGLLTLSTGPPSLIIDRYASHLGLFSQASESGNQSPEFCIQSRPLILENDLKRTDSAVAKFKVSDTGNNANDDILTISLVDNSLKTGIDSGQSDTILGRMLASITSIKKLGLSAMVGIAAVPLFFARPNEVHGAPGDRVWTIYFGCEEQRKPCGADYDNSTGKFYFIDLKDNKVYSRQGPGFGDATEQAEFNLETGDTYFGLGVGEYDGVTHVAVSDVSTSSLVVYKKNGSSWAQETSKVLPGTPGGPLGPKGVAFDGNNWAVFILQADVAIKQYDSTNLNLVNSVTLAVPGVIGLGDSELAFDSQRNVWYLIKGDDSGFYTFNISGSSAVNVNSWEFSESPGFGDTTGAGFDELNTQLVTLKNYSSELDCDWMISYEGYVPPAPTPTPVPSPSPAPSTTPHIYNIDTGDYNGDGIADVAIFRKNQGSWSVRGITRAYFGSSNYLPVAGDFNNDGTSEMAVFRGNTGLWSIRGGTRAYFGSSDDIPVPGDYNGDGYCDIGVFRSSDGLWSIRNVTRAYLGTAGDIPVPGYFTGDRAKSIAVFRPSSALWSVRGLTRFYFGQAEDYPLTADFNGSGLESAVVFRRSGGFWAARNITRIYLGGGEDIPIPADYGGGEGGEAAIFRPSSGYWAIRDLTRAYFGQSGDLPVAGRPCWPVTPTPTPIPSATPSATPLPSATPSPTASPTPWSGPTPMPTPVFTPVPTPSPSPG